MAALPYDFDTPQTASGQLIHVTGTVPIGEIYVAACQLAVTRVVGGPDYFYITKEYDNSTGVAVDVVTDDIPMAIVPRLETGKTVTLTNYGSLIGQIVAL